MHKYDIDPLYRIPISFKNQNTRYYANYFSYWTTLHVDVLNKYIDLKQQSSGGHPALWESCCPTCASLPDAPEHPAHPAQPEALPTSLPDLCLSLFITVAPPSLNRASRKHLALKFRTCQVRGSSSPGRRSYPNGPQRCCGVSSASRIKVKWPGQHAQGHRFAPPESRHHPYPSGTSQVFSLSRLGSCYQVASTPLSSRAGEARTPGLRGRPASPRARPRRYPRPPRVDAPPRQEPGTAPSLSPSLAVCALAWTPRFRRCLYRTRPFVSGTHGAPSRPGFPPVPPHSLRPRFPGPDPGPLDQVFWGWDPKSAFLLSIPEDEDAQRSVAVTALGRHPDLCISGSTGPSTQLDYFSGLLLGLSASILSLSVCYPASLRRIL